MHKGGKMPRGRRCRLEDAMKYQIRAASVAALSLGLVLALTLAVTPAACAQTDASVPHLQKMGAATQLIVDGKPFLALAGELHNSSSSSLEYMRPIWPRLAALHVNTVLTPVSWELIEPEEGKFDFTLVDGLIQDARRANLRIAFLWFGSWKNGMSTYAPVWVKTNYERFPRAQDETGRPLEILSTLSAANRDADARAYAALMRHIREVDGREHTVLMMQVENEVGVLEESRDRSPAGNAAFAKPVPKELMDYLQKHKDTLIPEFRKAWEDAGGKTSGTWEEVFGPGKPKGLAMPVRTLSPPLTPEEHETGWRNLRWTVDEVFMAWQYARYVGKVVEAGKAEYNIPMYVNAWLQQRDHAWPGTYPSGGPLPQVMDIWHAGAPALDMLSPDLYVQEFDELCTRYVRSGNPLFIPESAGDARGAANVFAAFGQYAAMGYSPFGIENPNTADPEGPIAKAYEFLSSLTPLILEHQETGTIAGVALDKDHPTRKVQLGNYTMEVSFARFWWTPQNPEYAAAIIVATGEDEYIVAGKGVGISFSANTPGPAPGLVTGLAMVEEGTFVNGRWIPGRRLNGDEIMSGKGVRLAGDHYLIQRVKLYRYR
jgi:beta-galactosidase GanA